MTHRARPDMKFAVSALAGRFSWALSARVVGPSHHDDQQGWSAHWRAASRMSLSGADPD